MLKEQEIREQLINQLVEVYSGVLVVQPNGMCKSLKKNQLVELTRQRIMETNSQVVVVDLTGMSSIDTKMTQYLVDIIREA